MTYHVLQAAAAYIASKTPHQRHRIAVVLGSGLGDYAAALPNTVVLPYAEIPEMPTVGVAGHAGTLYSTTFGESPTLLFSGRAHYYEGHGLDTVVFGVRAAVLAGCDIVLLTNAAGGAGDGLEPGDLVAIRDHLNLTGRNPLMGPNDDRLGPRFPDMSAAYDPELRSLAHQVGTDVGVPLKEGVYAWFSGPSYETPAEVQMAKRLGADLVGMSTVPETIAARHMGARVVALSLVTNLAAGISATPLSHEEVKETAATARDRFTTLLDALLPAL